MQVHERAFCKPRERVWRWVEQDGDVRQDAWVRTDEATHLNVFRRVDIYVSAPVEMSLNETQDGMKMETESCWRVSGPLWNRLILGAETGVTSVNLAREYRTRARVDSRSAELAARKAAAPASFRAGFLGSSVIEAGLREEKPWME